MGEVEEQVRSTAAPVIFLIVVAFQFGYKYLDDLRKEASKSPKEVELRAEIKRLLSEASTLAQPSTFAQAAKLRRVAAAKEKELSKYQEVRTKEVNLSFDLYLKVAFLAKVLTYLILVYWFWRTPVSSVSQQLVQPFGKLLSWKAGGHSTNDIMVGIIPWLILCTRVSRFISRFVN